MTRNLATSSAMAVIAWSIASTAQAQTVMSAPAAPESASASAPAAPLQAGAQQDAAAGPAVTTGDIIVTAQRRSESVQKASLSIAAIDGGSLATRGVVDSQSLNGVVPGLKISFTGAQVQLYVRGIGDQTTNPLTQPSVTLNMDGVYVARSAAFGPLFFDTARVEVLRGPQGTLYGRNASGGAINIISNPADLNHLGGFASAEFGNYNLRRFQGAVNVPVSDTLALRLAGQVTHRDGYLTDGSNDDKSYALRFRALWKPTDALSVSLLAELAHVGGQGFNRGFRPTLFGDAYVGPQDPRITSALFPALKNRYASTNDIKSRTVSMEINYNFGDVTLTVLPAYRYNKTNYFAGADYLFTDFDTSNQKSIEARLSGDTSGLKWVVGGYAFKEDLSIDLFTDQRTQAAQTGQEQTFHFPTFDTEAKAGFAEGTYSVSSAFRLIAGARYTDETRTRTGSVTSQNFTNGVAAAATSVNFDQALHYSAVTWRGGMEYDLAPTNMLYGTVSRGFKTGGFDAQDADTYGPEYVTAFTVGSKNRFLGNKLIVNLEGFYWKYRDQQISFLGLDSTGAVSFLTRNAGKSTIYGLSLDTTYRPTRLDTFTLAGEYLHTNYKSFFYSTLGNTPAGTALSDGCVSAGPTPGAPGSFLENCSGNPLQRAPKWSGNMRYAHKFPLANGADVTLGGTAKGQTLQYLSVNYADPNFAQKTYGLLDVDLTYTAPSGRYSIQGYARNLTDKAVFTSASNNGSIAPTSGVARTASVAIGQPRTYGVRLRYNF